MSDTAEKKNNRGGARVGSGRKKTGLMTKNYTIHLPLNVAEEMESFIINMSFNKFGMVIFITLLTCFLGMVIPGSSLVVIFGPVFITTFANQ